MTNPSIASPASDLKTPQSVARFPLCVSIVVILEDFLGFCQRADIPPVTATREECRGMGVLLSFHVIRRHPASNAKHQGRKMRPSGG